MLASSLAGLTMAGQPNGMAGNGFFVEGRGMYVSPAHPRAWITRSRHAEKPIVPNTSTTAMTIPIKRRDDADMCARIVR